MVFVINDINNTSSIAMKKEDNHFEDAYKDFRTLKKSGQIPPQMMVKLDYLLTRIQGKGPEAI